MFKKPLPNLELLQYRYSLAEGDGTFSAYKTELSAALLCTAGKGLKFFACNDNLNLFSHGLDNFAGTGYLTIDQSGFGHQ